MAKAPETPKKSAEEVLSPKTRNPDASAPVESTGPEPAPNPNPTAETTPEMQAAMDGPEADIETSRPTEDSPPDAVSADPSQREVTLSVTAAEDPTKLASQATIKLEDLQTSSPFVPTAATMGDGGVLPAEQVALDADGMPRSVADSPVEAFLGDANGDNTPKAPHPRMQTDAGAPDPMKRQPGTSPATANIMEPEGKTPYVLSAPWFDGNTLHARGTILYFEEGAQPRGSKRVEGTMPEPQPKNDGPNLENSNV